MESGYSEKNLFYIFMETPSSDTFLDTFPSEDITQLLNSIDILLIEHREWYCEPKSPVIYTHYSIDNGVSPNLHMCKWEWNLILYIILLTAVLTS